MNDPNTINDAKQPATTSRTIMHMNYLVSSAESKAKALESKAGIKGSVGVGMYEKRLREAAVTHLRLGHIKEYCDILVELHEWEKAISIAPSVSMEYWQSLANKYSLYLATQDSENAEEWLLITNNLPKVPPLLLVCSFVLIAYRSCLIFTCGIIDLKMVCWCPKWLQTVASKKYLNQCM
jgi:hypothetical protein